MTPHYFVAQHPSGTDHAHAKTLPPDACRRPGCGKPRDHPVHLRPPRAAT